MRWAVLLAGGSGTRFWPLSTPQTPKQLLPALRRRLDGRGGGRASHRADPARADPGRRRETGWPPGSARCSASPPRTSWSSRAPRPPRRRSSGPRGRRGAATRRRGAVAARRLGRGRRRRVPPHRRRRARPRRGRHDRLVTVGVVPSRPETGYGYIVPGAPLDGGGANRRPVLREARRRHRARPDGGGRALEQRPLRLDRAAAPERGRAAHARGGLRAPPRSRPATWPASSATSRRSRSTSGLLERSDAVAVVSGAFAWDDVGTWQALARVRPKDPSGNVVVGRGVLQESHDCIVWSERDPVVLCGVQDLVVVQANGRILVMPTERAAADEAAARRPARPTFAISGHDRPLPARAERSGRRVGAVRRRAADRRAPRGRLAHAGALGGGVPDRRHRDPRRPRASNSTKATSRPSGRWSRSTARRSSAPRGSRPRVIGSRICTRPAPCADCAMATTRSAGSFPRASDGTGRTSADEARRGGRARPARRVRSGHRAGAIPRRGLRRPPGGAGYRRARGQPRAGRRGQRRGDGRGGRAGRGLRRAPRRGRARAGCRGAARHSARGPRLRRRALEGAGRIHPRLGVRPGVPGPRGDRGVASSSATPTRATTASSATASWATG